MGQFSTTAYRKASSSGSGTQPGDPSIIASIVSQNNKNSKQASPPHPDDPTDAKSKPQQKPASYDSPIALFGGSWNSTLDPDPFISSQDVRCLGPLLDPSKLELDADRNIAKKQWRELCATHVLKQKVAEALWEKTKELEVRCKDVDLRYKDAEMRCKDSKLRYESMRKELNAVSAVREEIEAENSRLKAEIRHTKNAMTTLRENAMEWREVEIEKMHGRCLYQQGEMDRLRKERNGIRYWVWRLGMGLPLLMLVNIVYPHAPAF